MQADDVDEPGQVHGRARVAVEQQLIDEALATLCAVRQQV
jgi:hypothetical protein